MRNDHIMIGSYEKVQTFKYLGSLSTNQNSIQEIKCLKTGSWGEYMGPREMLMGSEERSTMSSFIVLYRSHKMLRKGDRV